MGALVGGSAANLATDLRQLDPVHGLGEPGATARVHASPRGDKPPTRIADGPPSPHVGSPSCARFKLMPACSARRAVLSCPTRSGRPSVRRAAIVCYVVSTRYLAHGKHIAAPNVTSANGVVRAGPRRRVGDPATRPAVAERQVPRYSGHPPEVLANVTYRRLPTFAGQVRATAPSRYDRTPVMTISRVAQASWRRRRSRPMGRPRAALDENRMRAQYRRPHRWRPS
jgi:hypothetical protein